MCRFVDNRQCEEWALFRGECPLGGVRVTGYATPAARVLPRSPGAADAVTAGSNTTTEEGTCTFDTGKSCDAGAYHRGQCARR